jgi:Fe-S cluster biogenesis protein NfuA
MTIELKIRTQSTPNPQALKFIMNRDVKAEGKVSFTSPQSCHHVPLANAIFGLGGVVQVHLYENILTITQDGAMNWAILTPRIIEIIQSNIEQHDPWFESSISAPKEIPEELRVIDDILDRTIRPSLQLDGGDLQVTGKDGHYIKIAYEGACGGCPSSTSGTLYAIESVLRQEYDPEAIVVIDESVVPDAYHGY